MIAHVCIHGDYPSTKPVILVQLEDHKQGLTLTRLNSDMIMVSHCHMSSNESFMGKGYGEESNLKLGFSGDTMARCQVCFLVLLVLSSLRQQQYILTKNAEIINGGVDDIYSGCRLC